MSVEVITAESHSKMVNAFRAVEVYSWLQIIGFRILKKLPLLDSILAYVSPLAA
jgi:hypothetical protein